MLVKFEQEYTQKKRGSEADRCILLPPSKIDGFYYIIWRSYMTCGAKLKHFHLVYMEMTIDSRFSRNFLMNVVVKTPHFNCEGYICKDWSGLREWYSKIFSSSGQNSGSKWREKVRGGIPHPLFWFENSNCQVVI